MLEPYSNEVVGIVIVGFLIAFFLAFGVGANDVANSFGTSVGSGVLTFKQACVLATIFEILGALIMGYKVSDTVRKTIFDISMYDNEEKLLMMGNVAALLGSAVWNLLATLLSLPISGTHSIIGAVLGFTMVARGFKGINWKMLGFIVSSWFLSPILSGIMSTILFILIRKFIIERDNSMDAGLKFLPAFYGFTLLVNVFSVVHDGSSVLGFDKLNWWSALILSIAVGFIAALVVRLAIVPRQRRLLQDMEDRDPVDEKAISVELEKLSAEVDEKIISDTDEQKIFLTEAEDDKPSVAHLFKGLQIMTAVFGSFAHGGNDVSNAIAPLISLWLIYAEGSSVTESETPLWLLLYGGAGISIGLWVLGRKVIETMGKDLTKITPSSGFTIEIGAATTVLIASKIGLPISTTHCKVGSVVSVGYVRSKKTKGVDLSLFRNIILAWFVTLPFTALLSAATTAVMYALTVK